MSDTKTESSTAKQNTGIRLSGGQIDALKVEAKRISKRTKMKCGWTTVVGFAIDEYIGLKRSAKRAAAK
jgi:6-phosphogluconolactonase/glucosamine-6-phosphate isomerase/deaminase